MAQMNVNIMGNPLVLSDSDVIPDGNHRVGSVTLLPAHGEPKYVHIYGSVRIYGKSKEREVFEKEVRKTCENPAVIEIIFGYNGSLVKSRRFNPSIAQKRRGWYTGVHESKTIH